MDNSSDREPIRWLHLSDFHVGKDEYAQRKLFAELLLHLGQRKEQGYTPDLIFITGDIANRGASTEYTQFIDEFLTPLQNLYGEDTSSRTFVVPGNHDVQRGINKYFDRNEICAGDSLFFDPTKSGSAERQQVLPRFKNYSEQTMLTPSHGSIPRWEAM